MSLCLKIFKDLIYDCGRGQENIDFYPVEFFWVGSILINADPFCVKVKLFFSAVVNSICFGQDYFFKSKLESLLGASVCHLETLEKNDLMLHNNTV